ncbi:pericentrin-like isoform X4 [Anguilla rostrata]|uniref:pericentrin-like isoform X4 n=1 Tax=Anguilla rostrata TaxID=7938 RepID=UPI0030D0A341
MDETQGNLDDGVKIAGDEMHPSMRSGAELRQEQGAGEVTASRPQGALSVRGQEVEELTELHSDARAGERAPGVDRGGNAPVWRPSAKRWDRWRGLQRTSRSAQLLRDSETKNGETEERPARVPASQGVAETHPREALPDGTEEEEEEEEVVVQLTSVVQGLQVQLKQEKEAGQHLTDRYAAQSSTYEMRLRTLEAEREEHLGQLAQNRGAERQRLSEGHGEEILQVQQRLGTRQAHGDHVYWYIRNPEEDLAVRSAHRDHLDQDEPGEPWENPDQEGSLTSGQDHLLEKYLVSAALRDSCWLEDSLDDRHLLEGAGNYRFRRDSEDLLDGSASLSSDSPGLDGSSSEEEVDLGKALLVQQCRDLAAQLEDREKQLEDREKQLEALRDETRGSAVELREALEKRDAATEALESAQRHLEAERALRLRSEEAAQRQSQEAGDLRARLGRLQSQRGGEERAREEALGLIAELREEKEQLLVQLRGQEQLVWDVQEQKLAGDSVTCEVQALFGRQLIVLQEQRDRLQGMLDRQQAKNQTASRLLGQRTLEVDSSLQEVQRLREQLAEREEAALRAGREKQELESRLCGLQESLAEAQRAWSRAAEEVAAGESRAAELETRARNAENATETARAEFQSRLEARDREVQEVNELLEEMQRKQSDLGEEQKSRIALIKQVHERERRREMAELAAEREAELSRLEAELKEGMEAAHQAELLQAQTQHSLELETLRLSLTNQHALELETMRLSLTNQHALELEQCQSAQQRHTEAALSEQRESLEAGWAQDRAQLHAQQQAELDRVHDQNRDQARRVQQQHRQEKDDLNQEWEARMQKEKVRMEELQANQIEALRAEWQRESDRAQEELQSRLKETQEALSASRAQLEEQEELRASRERELLRLGEELSRARAERDAAAGADDVDLVASHQGALQEQQDRAQRLEELCTASAEREQRLQQEVERLQADHVTLKWSSEQEVDRLRTELERMRASCQDPGGLREQLLARSPRGEEVQPQEEVHRQELAQAEEEVQRLTRELSQVEEVQRQEEVEELKQELSQAEEEVQQLKQELSQAAEEVQQLKRELSQQQQEIQEQKEAELKNLRSYFERRLRVAEESHREEVALLQRRLAEVAEENAAPQGGNASFLSEGDVDEDKADMLAEINMKLEKHKEELYSLRLRLEEKHTAELDQLQASLTLSHREQLLQVKTHLADRYFRQTQDLKTQHSQELEQQRAKLTEHHAKEISRLRLRSAQDAARQVEQELEERGRALAGQARSERSRIRGLEEQLAALRMGQEEQLRQAAERSGELAQKAQEKLKQDFAEQLRVAVREAQAQERERALQELSQEKEEALGRLREELRAQEETRVSALREELERAAAEERRALQEQQEEEERRRGRSPRDSPESESDPRVLAVRRKVEAQFQRELLTAKRLMAEEVKELNAVLLEQAEAKLQEAQRRFQKEQKEREEKLGLEQEAALRDLTKKHGQELESQKALLGERVRSLEEDRQNLEERLEHKHGAELDSLRAELQAKHKAELHSQEAELQAKHKAELDSLEAELRARLQGDRDELEARMLSNMDTLESAYLAQIQAGRDERDGALQALRDRERGHAAQLDRLRTQHQAKLGLICIELRRELDQLLMDKSSSTAPQPAQNQPSTTASEPAQNKPSSTAPQPAQNQPSSTASEQAQTQKLSAGTSGREDPEEEVLEEVPVEVLVEQLEEPDFEASGDRVALGLGQLFSKLKTDLRTVAVERRGLLEAHVQLQEVLQEVVRRTVATEEEILRRIRAHAEPGVGCGGEAGEKLPDSALRSALTDEGVGLSQKPWQSLFSGLGLGRDPQVEEAVLGVSARLCSVVRKLLDLSQLEPHPPRPRVPLEEHLIQSGPDSAPSQLQEYRPPEQLHRGPVEFGAVEKAALEEVLQQKEAQVQGLVEELQRLDVELQELREERALLLRQREALAEPLGDTERALLGEAQRLLQEKVEAQRQAEEDRSRLASRLRLMEVEVEERDGGRLEAEERRRAQVEDLRLQVHALEKQLRHHRQFIDEQAVERELEREEFQQEIQRLEARLRRSSRPRPGGGGGGGGEEDKIEDLVLQVENLRAAIRQKSEDCERLLLTKEKYRGDVAEQNEQIHTMAARICELERALLDTSPSGHALAPQDAAQDRAPLQQLLCSSCLQVFALQRNLDDPRQCPPRSGAGHPLDQQLQAIQMELRTAGVGQVQENDHAVRPLPEADGHEDTPSVRLAPPDQLEEQRREIRQLGEEILRLRREADASQDQAAEEARAEVEELRSQVEHLRSDRERLRQDREVEEERLHEVIHKLQEELERAESTRYELSTSSENSPAPPLPHTPRGLEHSLRQELSRHAPVPEPRGEAHPGPGGTGAQKRGGDAPDGTVPAETLRTVLEALQAQVQEGQARIHELETEKEELRQAKGHLQEEVGRLRQEVTSKRDHIQHLNSGLGGRTAGAGDLRETVAEETLAKAEVALRENEERLAQGRAEHEALWAEHDALNEEHEALKEEHEALKEEHEALKEEHEALKEEHEALKAEHEALKAEHEVLWAEHVSLKMKFAAVQEELGSSAHRTETLMEESQTEDRALADLDIHSQLLGLSGQQGEPESRSLQGDACTRHGAPGRSSFLSGLRYEASPRPPGGLRTPSSSGDPASELPSPPLSQDLSQPPEAFSTPLTLSASASEPPSTRDSPPASEPPSTRDSPLSEQVRTLDERYFTGLEEWPSDADCSSVSSHRDTTLQEQWGAPEGLSASFLEYLHNRDMSVAGRTDSATESMGQDAELLSPELQSWLKRVYREGHRVLSLSERPVPVAVTTPSPDEAPPPSWQAERRALQQTVLSLRELLCKMAAREPKEEQWRLHLEQLLSADRLALLEEVQHLRSLLCASSLRSQEQLRLLQASLSAARGEGSQCRHGELLEPHLTERRLGRTDQQTTQRAGGAEQKAQLWAEQTGGAEQKAQLWGEEQKAQLWEGLVSTEMSQEAERHQQREQSPCEALITEESNRAIDHAHSLEEEVQRRQEALRQLEEEVQRRQEALRQLEEERVSHVHSLEEEAQRRHKVLRQLEEERASHACSLEEEVQRRREALRQLEEERVNHACSLEEEVQRRRKVLRQLEGERVNHACSLEEEVQRRREVLRQLEEEAHRRHEVLRQLEEEKASHTCSLEEQARQHEEAVSEDRRFIQELRVQLEQERGQSEELAAAVERLHRQVVHTKRQLEEEAQRRRKAAQGEHKAALGLEEQRRRANQLQAQLDLLREEARSAKEERRTLRRQEEQEETDRKHSSICHRLSQSAALQADGCNAETELQLSVHMANQPYNSKVQRLYCRFLRAESHRKALAFQKRYLLLLLGGARDGQHATLALVARMGACPSPAAPPPRPSPAARFRTAALAAIAVSRLSLLVRKWQRAFRTSPPDSAQTTEHSSRAGSSINTEVLRRQQQSAARSSAPSCHTQPLARGRGLGPVRQVTLQPVQQAQPQTIRQNSN